MHVLFIAELKIGRKIKWKVEKIIEENIPLKVIPVVVGALGTTPKKLKQQLSDMEIETRIVEL